MQIKNILFYTCFNIRSIQLESSIYYFHEKGYKVFFITTCEKGPIHFELESSGISVYYNNLKLNPRFLFYLKLIVQLIKFSKKNKIDFIHSHLQIPNLISSISRFFIVAKVFNVRHNSDVVMLSGSKKEKLIDYIINSLSNNIIAISEIVKDHLIKKEKVNPNKIIRINNGYNFEKYEKLISGNNFQDEIRHKYKSDFLVVSPGRLIETKRHEISIKAFKVFKEQGLDIKLLILGDGPDFEKVQTIISQNNLLDRVYLLGYQENISDYLKAADLITLLSVSEASNNVIKEAGYFEKPVIVCSNVGDFDDYIESGKNGFLVSKTNPESEFVKIVTKIYYNKDEYTEIGKNLKKTILEKFNIESVGVEYEKLQNSHRNN